MQVVIGSQWFAKWSVGRADAMVWTVRGITSHGIYIRRCDVHWNGEMTSFRLAPLQWWDDASYIDYQCGDRFHEDMDQP